jgi:hypothetical protein
MGRFAVVLALSCKCDEKQENSKKKIEHTRSENKREATNSKTKSFPDVGVSFFGHLRTTSEQRACLITLCLPFAPLYFATSTIQ